MKRIFCLFLIAACLLSAQPSLAAAGGVCPPRRQECPLKCGRCGSSLDCPSCSLCQAVFCTARPAATAGAPAAARPTAKPAPRPTAAPSAMPTARPASRPTAAPAGQPPVSTGDYTTISVTAQEQKLLNLLNRDRAANGLAPLQLDDELSRIARVKSCDMNENKYFAHESPTYGRAAAMLTSFGYPYQGVGENIAHHATAEKAEAAFMSSPGHRANILGSQWKKVGIGICLDPSGFVCVTQLFVR